MMKDYGSHSSQQHILELPEDRLSTLPNNIIDVILLCLSLKDAARTCILSHFWKYQWTNLSQLEFDNKDFPRSVKESDIEYDRRIVKIVDQILILHRGPIRRFRLSVYLVSCIDINRWILFLSRNGIREIILHRCIGEMYRMPSCLFLCEDIVLLNLYRCRLVVPASFNGFTNLTTLGLQFVSLSNTCLEKLISNCPLLSVLALTKLIGCTDLKLCAPNLVDLNVDECGFQDIWFVKTPILAEASINLWSYKENLAFSGGAKNKLISILGCLPSIRRLCLLGASFKILSAGCAPDMLPTTSQLLNLSISVNFDDMQHMLITHYIFKNSSSLQNVEILSISDTDINESLSIDDFWGAQGDLSCLFSQLRTLYVTEFTGTTAELKFIESVLANAPVLDIVQIEIKKEVADVVMISKRLNRFRRLSLAEVVIPD